MDRGFTIPPFPLPVRPGTRTGKLDPPCPPGYGPACKSQTYLRIRKPAGSWCAAEDCEARRKDPNYSSQCSIYPLCSIQYLGFPNNLINTRYLAYYPSNLFVLANGY